MEWLTCIKEAIKYMENNLTDIRSPEDVADHVHMSSVYLQRGFQVLTGYSIGEYIRNRKLYLAAEELKSTKCSVLEATLKYGYETQASFDKAFTRFHGVTPKDIRKPESKIKAFLPLKVNISITGGEVMQYRFERKNSIKIVGIQKEFSGEDSYKTIPEFWDETINKYASHLMKGEAPQGEMETYVAGHHIGEFGVCMDNIGKKGKFNYIIGGYYKEDDVPDDMTVVDIPAGDWVVFECTMSTLQTVNTKIWKEWAPGNSEYEITGGYNIEWYSPNSEPGPNQACEIWIPVAKIAK